MFNLTYSEWKNRKNFLKAWEFRNTSDVDGFIIGTEFTTLRFQNILFVLNEERVINTLERIGFIRMDALPPRNTNIHWSDLLGPGYKSPLYYTMFQNTKLNIVVNLIDQCDWNILVTTKEITNLVELTPDVALMLFTKSFKILNHDNQIKN